MVYVIDGSGSMVTEGVFDTVKTHLITSISYRSAVDGFHVILFSAEGKSIENPPRKIVPATRDNKRAVVEFLEPILAEGKTDPVPALGRAFEVLEKNDLPGKGKVIFLLTDGVFPDNDAVLRLIADRNAKKEVLIYTYLYGNNPPDAAVEVMKKIAAENGGKYKWVKEE